MPVIDSSTKFVGINPNFPTAERKSAQNNAAQEVFTMQDIADTVLNVSPTPPDPAPLAFANAATVGALSYSPVYNNGTAGVGATLTATVNGVLRDTSAVGKIDTSYTPIAGDVILVKNQSSALQNGLYVITTVGSVSTPYALTRFTDFDQSEELYPLQVNVIGGNSNTLKYFIQTTTNPTIGTSSLVFSLSNLQSTVSQIAFIDTVIDTALSNIVYANGTTFPTIPGSGATLTSTVNGALGTYYGLTANTNSTIANSFTRVLLINQTNPAYNGDYQVINAGSASTRWQLRRIQNYAGGFDRYTRYFTVSNAGSTKAGKIYFTKPNSPVLTNATVGTAAINIFEYGGASFGPFGIANSSGVYTYYNTFTLAMSAATSGQTVEMFADVTETTNVSVNLKDGVNINGNGHIYTLNVAGTSNCIQDNGVAINCSISNITFTRLGGTASSTNTLCMHITGASKIKAYSTILIGGATNMRCLTINNGNAEVFGIYAEGYNPAITITNGTLNDSTAKSLNGTGIIVGASGKIVKCIGYGIGAQGIYNEGLSIDSTGYDSNGGFSNFGTAINCTGWSNGGIGFGCGSSSTNISCNGYSTANVGFAVNAATNVVSCKGYSTANVGLSIINGTLYDCLGYSTVNNGISTGNSGGVITELRSCKAISLAAIALFMNNTISGCKTYNTEAYSRWNNAGGHGIRVSGNNAEIVQCTIEVTNASANVINATTALTTKYANNAFKGATVPINANITQGMINIHDLQGNILI
jgi:hypothetical protein